MVARNSIEKMRSFLLLAGTAAAYAQGFITTIAGTDWLFPATPLPATLAPLGQVTGIVADNRGNVIVCDQSNHIVVRISAGGRLTVVAGNGLSGYSGDGGEATRASMVSPIGLAMDAQENLYIADASFAVVRKVSADGIITTIAGRLGATELGDGGPATQARLRTPVGLTFDGDGNLYIADNSDMRVRKVDRAGVITTVAGNGLPGGGGDGGPATTASLNSPFHLKFDPSGNLLVVEASGGIRKITGGTIVTLLRLSGPNNPSSLGFDSGGNLLIGSLFSIDRLRPDGTLGRIAGTGNRGYSGDGGPATAAAISVSDFAVDGSGNILISDVFANRVRRVAPSTIVTTIAGNGGFRVSEDGVAATSANVRPFGGIAVDAQGSVYFADLDHRVRRITASGRLEVVAGTGAAGFSGDGGPATAARLNNPRGVAVDSGGNLYIADQGNAVVRRVTPAGLISAFAGNGQSSSGGDGGPAAAASLVAPQGLAFDAAGNLLIADSPANKIRKVSPQGVITTFAGTGQIGFSGDNGPATAATFRGLNSVSVDSAGNVYIADLANFRVRRIAPDGTITTVAGNGENTHSGDGAQAVNASLATPTDAVMIGDILYIAEPNAVRVVYPNGAIGTVFFGDVGAIARDAAGNGYFTQPQSGRVRKILADPPVLQLNATRFAFAARSMGPLAAPQRLSMVASAPGVPFLLVVTTETGEPWLEVTPTVEGQTPRLLEVIADPAALAPGEYRGEIFIITNDTRPSQTTIPVTFTVGEALPPELRADKEHLLFPFPRAGRRRSQILVVSNNGGGPLPFTVEATTVSGGAWLTATPTQGNVTPRTQQPLTVSADPSGLAAGTYSGTITLRAGTRTVAIPVTMTISDRDTAVLLSQSGLSFVAVAGGGVVPTQEFGILNIGDGVMPWSVTASTISGGNWLSVTPASGSTNAANVVPTVAVRVNQTNLAPGRYYGLVTVNAPQSANSPQVLTVLLDVLPTGSNPGSVFQPEELTFEFPAGPMAPSSSEAQLYNLASSPLAFRTVTFQRAQHLPRDATVSPQQPTRIVVQPAPFPQPGTYRDNLTMQFSDGTVATLRLLFNVSAPAAAATGKSRAAGRTADGCAPSRLVPSFLSVGQATTASAGAPSAMALDVKDDCGAPLTAGNVVVSFSNGDAPVILTPLRDGRWHGTWRNRDTARSTVVLKAEARDPERNLSGDREVQADLRTTQERPVVPPNAIVSAASNVSYQALGPGAMISVYGQNLTDGLTDSAGSLPLPTRLGGSQVIVNGRPLALVFASPGQINAVAHYDLNLNTIHQVIVNRPGAYSDPVAVAVGPAQPAVFTASGRAIVVATRDRASWLVSPAEPARAGDSLVIYCSGLGAVEPPIAAGARVPESPLRPTRETPRVTIAGVEAAVAFSGLTPGLAGLYQINATMPAVAARDGAAPLTIEIFGQRSVAAPIAVE